MENTLLILVKGDNMKFDKLMFDIRFYSGDPKWRDKIKKFIRVHKNNLNQKDPSSGNTLLIKLISDRVVDLSLFLLDTAVDLDLNISNNSQETALILASLYGLTDVVKKLIEMGADIHKKDNRCRTAFMYAAGNNNLDIVKLLLEKGVNINEQTPDGETALMKAVEYGQLETVNYLIESGADVNIKTRKNETAVMYAIGLSHVTTERRVEVLQSLIKAGADLNIPGSWNSQTPLLRAIGYNKYEIVKLLIESGADINIRDKDGNTALFLASLYSLYIITKLLIEAGADVNAQTPTGQTALIGAMISNHSNINVIELLLESGANPNIKNIRGNTALTYACMRGQTDLAELLIKYKADVNCITVNMDTPYSLSKNIYPRPYYIKKLIDFLLSIDNNINGKYSIIL